MKLIDILKEIDQTLIGPEYGSGIEHTVYSYGKDKILKVRDMGRKLGYHVNIFIKYPEIFPKVYEIEEDYVILEKLDDKKFQKEIWDIKKRLFSKNNKSVSSEDRPNNEYIASLTQNKRNNGSFYYDSDIMVLIYDNLEDIKLKEQFNKELPDNLYNIIINNYYPLLTKIKNLTWEAPIREKDITDENFGYNSEGILKALDI